MTRYVVVTRDKNPLPVERFITIEAAADYIVQQVAFGKWTVLVQEDDNITASTPYRTLRKHEKRKLEQRLYPTLYE